MKVNFERKKKRTNDLKIHSLLVSTSAFAFSKIMEAIVTKCKTQRMGSVPIPCVNINVRIDTMLKFDANADTNVDFDAKCECTFT